MKKFTNTVVGLFMASMLVVPAIAATTVKATNAPVVIETVRAPVVPLYSANEFGLSLSSGYDVGAAGTVNGSTLFSQPYNFNLTAGAFYFPLRNVGFELNLPFYNTTGVSVDEIQFGTLFRLPLSADKPVFKNLAPYIGIGGVANWKDQQKWAYIGKVGTEFRLNKHVGLFAEGQYRNCDFEWSVGAVSIQGGLRIPL
jgi:hypothetical protein